MAKKLTVEIVGDDWSDLEQALWEIREKVSYGFLSGFDRNDTGRFTFNITELEGRVDDA